MGESSSNVDVEDQNLFVLRRVWATILTMMTVEEGDVGVCDNWTADELVGLRSKGCMIANMGASNLRSWADRTVSEQGIRARSVVASDRVARAVEHDGRVGGHDVVQKLMLVAD
jgi:hypothetical protein